MKAIFALVFGLFMAISSFSQVESLLASIEIFDATQVEIVETDAVEAVISECDPLGEMSFSEFIETDCALLEPIECEMIVMENVDKSTLKPVIETLVNMEKFEMSVSDLERTPDSVQDFVASVNDSTIFIAETQTGFIAVNSGQDLQKYSTLILADTILIGYEVFIFSDDQLEVAKNFLIENYKVENTENCAFSINLVSGYTEAEEIAKNQELAERKNKGKKLQAEPKVLPKKSRETKVDLAETKPAKPEAHYNVYTQTPKEENSVVFNSSSNVVAGMVDGNAIDSSSVLFTAFLLLLLVMFAKGLSNDPRIKIPKGFFSKKVSEKDD